MADPHEAGITSGELPPNPTLAAWRAEIIDGVLTEGLKPGKSLKREGKIVLNSGYPPTPFIDGNTFFPPQQFSHREPGAFERDLKSGLYGLPVGVFPIIAERYTDAIYEPLETINRRHKERFFSGFLVVCKGRTIEELQKQGASGLGTRIPIAPEFFHALIFPQMIWDEYRQISPVNISTNTVLSIATGSLIRKVGYAGESNVPNYEESLTELLVKEGWGRPLWVHAVRLPTEGDLDKLATSTLPRAD